MKLHTWLEETGHTYTWLAEKTGLSPTYVWRLIERYGDAPEKSPSLETCAKIAEATGGAVTANDFVPDLPAKRKRAHRNGVASAA